MPGAAHDGVLVVDKPAGMTSHDVVALARRAIGERRLGHTGTLDPMATGVLPLACGRATRLVRFLVASDKDYLAEIRFGVTTDTWDVTGTVVRQAAAAPAADAVEAALAGLRGGYAQTPPPYSAKKVGGRRAYAFARRDEPVTLEPVPVHVARADLVHLEGDTARVQITCSAGFYVRAFAHVLGERVGTGACLSALRRTRSGPFTLDGAVGVAALTGDPSGVAARLRPLETLLPGWPAVVVSDEGRRRVGHGQALGLAQVSVVEGSPPLPELAGPGGAAAPPGWVRVFDPAGRLVAMATRDADVLHPSIVLI